MKKAEKTKQNWLYVNIAAIAGIILALCMAGFLIGRTPSVIPNIQTSDYYCNRERPYPMPPEFERALSLVRQRQYSSESISVTPDRKKNIVNCLNIQYSDLSEMNAEGIFTFDRNSTTDELRILVDNTYKEYDDYLTATLLSHEIVHAAQFTLETHEGKSLSCYEKEEEAFRRQLDFLSSLNQEELESLVLKVTSNPNKNDAYAGVYGLINISFQAYQQCNSNSDACFYDSIDQQIKDMVRNNPGYQEQCSYEDQL